MCLLKYIYFLSIFNLLKYLYTQWVILLTRPVFLFGNCVVSYSGFAKIYKRYANLSLLNSHLLSLKKNVGPGTEGYTLTAQRRKCFKHVSAVVFEGFDIVANCITLKLLSYAFPFISSSLDKPLKIYYQQTCFIRHWNVAEYIVLLKYLCLQSNIMKRSKFQTYIKT